MAGVTGGQVGGQVGGRSFPPVQPPPLSSAPVTPHRGPPGSPGGLSGTHRRESVGKVGVEVGAWEVYTGEGGHSGVGAPSGGRKKGP